MNPISRLLGIRVIEEVPGHHILMRKPRWIKGEKFEARMRSIEEDARLAGREVKITIGDTIVRVDYL